MIVSEGAVTVRAHAKINVFLRVTGARADGYHDLESLILPVSLHDVVTVRRVSGPEVRIQIEGEPRLVRLTPTGSANIAARAARRYASTTNGPLGAEILIEKHIPVAGGLGGGSADAAAVLAALHALGSPDGVSGAAYHSALRDLAAEIGSDVPAMLAAEPVLIGGRGERLTSVHTVTTWWVLKPFDFPVSAADAYAWWDDAPATGPDPEALVAGLGSGDLELLGSAAFNDLQAPVVARHPAIGDAIVAFDEAGALGALMTGSGPTVAALARHAGHADELAAALPGSIVVSAPPTRSGTRPVHAG